MSADGDSLTGSVRSSLAATALPLAGLRVSGQAAEFVAFVVLARRLGTSDFGQLSAWFLIARYLGLIADWGAYSRGSRDVAAGVGDSAILAYVRWRNRLTFGVSVGLVVVLLFTAPECLPLALCVLYRGLNRDWIALGRHNGMRAGMPGVVQGGLVLLLTIMLPVGNGLVLAATAVGAGYVAAAGLSILLNPLPGNHAVETVRAAPMIPPWVLLVLLSEQVLITADTVLLSTLRSASEAGIYAAVYRFPNAWMMVVALLAVGFIPSITESIRRDPSWAALVRRRILHVSRLSTGLLFVVAPIAIWAVPVIFGSEYDSGKLPLAILLVAAGFSTGAASLVPLILALGRERRLAWAACSIASVNVIANLLVIPWGGMVGAALVTLTTSVLSRVVHGLIARLRD